MFAQLIAFSLRNKFIVLLFTAGLAAWGIWSFTRLPIDAIPDITNNQVQIITQCPTLSTQEVEQFVTMPIEQEVRNSPGMIEMRSISRFGLSVITVVFEDEIPIYQARQIITERLNKATEAIPAHFGRPEMAPVSTGLGEILHYRIEPKPGYEDRYSPADLRTIQDWIVKRQLAGIQGVVEINSFGGYLKQYEVAVDPHRLRARDVSLGELYEAVAAANENTGGAYIEKASDVYFIRTEGLAHSLEDIEHIVVTERDGAPVLVGDLATVRLGHAIRYGTVTHNGEGEIVLGIVMMLKDANAAQVIQRVKERMEKVRRSLPEGVTITPFLDRENLVDRTIATVRNNLLEGALIVILVLVLLVGDLRAGLVIASVIPLAMLFAIGLMVQTGVSANLMSLGAIDFGLVVDGAVILVEATLFYLFQRFGGRPGGAPISREEMDESVRLAAGKVARSSVFGILIIVIVYLPILSLTGIEGKMFRPMALTVTYALLGALLLCLTYVPVVSSLFLSRRIRGENRITEFLMHRMQASFRPFFERALAWPKATVGLAFAALLGAGALFSTLGGEFIPELDEGDIMMHGFCKPGTSLTQTMESHRLAQRIILDSFPDEVDQVISKIGTAEIPTDPMAIETADNIILLRPKEEWTKTQVKSELVDMIQAAVQEVPGMAFEFTQPIKMRFDEMMTGVRSDLAVKVFGDNLDSLAHHGEEIARLVRQVDGARDVKVEQLLGLPQLRIAYRYDRLARHGITVQQANEAVRIALAGEVAGQIYENERRFDLVVRMADEQRKDAATLVNLPVRSEGGALVPLGELADIGFVNGAAQISREEGQRRVVISANVRGRDVESVVQDVEKSILANYKLPPGYHIAYGGQFENLREARSRLAIAVPVALLLIGLLLYFTFNSLRETALILTAIPMATIGGVLALWLRDMPFSISAGIGFIALFGVAVLNGIVLINYINELESEGSEGSEDLVDLVRRATLMRFRPVLMTAAVASFGFIPMAFTHGAGAEVQRPLATVVIGGLITSTMLTLLVLPALFLLVRRWQHRKLSTPGLAVVITLLASVPAMAQQSPVSEEDAVRTVLQRHPAMREASASLAERQALERHPLLWEPASVYHGIAADPELGMFGTTSVGIQATFPSLARSRQARRLATTRVRTGELALRRTAAMQEREVRELFLDFKQNAAEQTVLGDLDSLYSRLARIADARYRAGETGGLEARLVGDKARMVALERADLEYEYGQLCLRLGRILGDTVARSPQLEEPPAEVLPPWRPAADPAGTLHARILDGATEEARGQVLLRKAQLKPELGANLFAQYTPNGQYFPGYMFSLQFPLFRKGYKASIREAEASALRTAAARDLGILTLTQELADVEYRLGALRRRLDYFDTQGLPSAAELTRVAGAAYAGGSGSYPELILALEQAARTRLDHLEALYGYRRLVLHHTFLTQSN